METFGAIMNKNHPPFDSQVGKVLCLLLSIYPRSLLSDYCWRTMFARLCQIHSTNSGATICAIPTVQPIRSRTMIDAYTGKTSVHLKLQEAKPL